MVTRTNSRLDRTWKHFYFDDADDFEEKDVSSSDDDIDDELDKGSASKSTRLK